MQIEAGKYYEADNGDKVGPMEKWTVDDLEHPWQIEGGSIKYDYGGDIWRNDGTSNYGMPSLVSIWADVEPCNS